MRFVFSICLCLWATTTAAAQGRTYSGEEAAALRCANTMALTAVALSDTGLLDPQEREVMLQITILILERHVSGTWRQKKAALAVVRDRRDVVQTLDDFQDLAEQCLRQFPIN